VCDHLTILLDSSGVCALRRIRWPDLRATTREVVDSGVAVAVEVVEVEVEVEVEVGVDEVVAEVDEVEDLLMLR
jgi:hypothetical protein